MNPREIRALRERLGMTQQQFAFRLGLATRGAVTRLENGTRKPTGPVAELLRLLDQITPTPQG
jgi:DNA-binding transcriptional regulator YiaG